MKCFTCQDYLLLINKIAFLVMEDSAKYITKKKVNHPHDKIFRTVLDDKKQAIEIINKIVELKNKLTEDEIERYNSSYINKYFENQESDVVYKKKNQNIFFLIEHQTKIDYDMPRRILNYEIDIMREALENRKIYSKNEKLPMIIPIVLYTGRKKWDASQYISDCQEKLEGYNGTRFGEYYIIDINQYTRAELKMDESFLSKILLIEKSKDTNELIKNITDVIEEEKEIKNIELLQRIINYIYQKELGIEKIKELNEKIKMKGERKMALAVIEMLREEEKRHRREEKESIVKEMLKYGTEDEFIKKVTKITDKKLEKIKKEMKKR